MDPISFSNSLVPHVYIGLRVEFCKAYSRVRRWQEQVRLLRAEMDYCLRSLEAQAKEWERRAVIPQFTGEHAEGASAYAYEQAAVKRIIANRFRVLWAKYLIGAAEIEIAEAPPDLRMMTGADSDDEPGESEDESEDESDSSEASDNVSEEEQIDDEDMGL